MIGRRTFGTIAGTGAVAAALAGIATGCATTGPAGNKPAPPMAPGKDGRAALRRSAR